MYLLPENAKRRESVIAGLTAAIVGIAMIAVAGKASAMHDDAARANPPVAEAVAAGAEANARTEEKPNQAGARSEPDHATHAGHSDHASSQGHAHHPDEESSAAED